MKVSAATLVNFPLEPPLPIINNKQVEYISSIIMPPIRLDGVTLGDRAAVFRVEGGRDGDGGALVVSIIEEPNYIWKL